MAPKVRITTRFPTLVDASAKLEVLFGEFVTLNVVVVVVLLL